MMPRVPPENIALGALAAAVGLGLAACATPRLTEPQRYTIALFGDMPYGALGRVQYPQLLRDVNEAEVAFSIFLGDLQAGSDGPCTDERLYLPALASFAQLRAPLVWLPGDNDWTDCWGRYGPGTSAPGADDPLERLEHERSLFAAGQHSLGQRTLRLTRQSSAGGLDAAYSENVRWQHGPVVFLGLNVQGSNDNNPSPGVDGETRGPAAIAAQRAEATARQAANLRWLRQGFAHAKVVGAAAVLVAFQADLNFDNEQHLADPRSWDAFPAYAEALRAECLAFLGQVVLVHGDGHTFKIDTPLRAAEGGVLGNFTRVEVFGARDTHWVEATVDPRNPRVFTFEPRFVGANLDQPHPSRFRAGLLECPWRSR